MTESKSGRQKLQRSFAQEFLCPFTELETQLPQGEPGADDVEAAAAYFDVSPMAVWSAMVNRRRITHAAFDAAAGFVMAGGG